MRKLHSPHFWLPTQGLQPCRESSRRDAETASLRSTGSRLGSKNWDWVVDLIHLAVSLPASPLQNADMAVGPGVGSVSTQRRVTVVGGHCPCPSLSSRKKGSLAFLFLFWGPRNKVQRKPWLKGEETVLRPHLRPVAPPPPRAGCCRLWEERTCLKLRGKEPSEEGILRV